MNGLFRVLWMSHDPQLFGPSSRVAVHRVVAARLLGVVLSNYQFKQSTKRYARVNYLITPKIELQQERKKSYKEENDKEIEKEFAAHDSMS